MSCEDLFQNSDQEFLTAIITGESVTSFIAAKYELFAQFSNKPILTKTLDNGIVVQGNEFKTTIEKADVTKAGMYYHQFTVTNQLNQELPPIFSGHVKIKEVR